MGKWAKKKKKKSEGAGEKEREEERERSTSRSEANDGCGCEELDLIRESLPKRTPWASEYKVVITL